MNDRKFTRLIRNSEIKIFDIFVPFRWFFCDFFSVDKMNEKMEKEKSAESIAMRKFDYYRRFLAQVRTREYFCFIYLEIYGV